MLTRNATIIENDTVITIGDQHARAQWTHWFHYPYSYSPLKGHLPVCNDAKRSCKSHSILELFLITLPFNVGNHNHLLIVQCVQYTGISYSHANDASVIMLLMIMINVNHAYLSWFPALLILFSFVFIFVMMRRIRLRAGAVIRCVQRHADGLTFMIIVLY